MHDVAQRAQRPCFEQITTLLKEMKMIEHSGDDAESAIPPVPEREDRRQDIRRELVQIVNRLGWRQGLPLRIWLHARHSARIQ
jgi:hypothetical protein